MSVVLTPIDGSERALRAVPWAAMLAGSGGTVVLLRVIPPKPAYAEGLLALLGEGEDGVAQTEAAWTEVAQADIDEAAQALKGTGVTIERLIGAAEPEDAIVAGATERDVDMIAMASHGRGAIGRAIFGSVTDRVTRTATVPVFVLRVTDEETAPAPDLRRIVVPLDGSEIAERALPVAAEIAAQRHIPVSIVRAIDPVTAMPMTSGAFGGSPAISADVVDQVWRESEAQAHATVHDAVARLKAEGLEATGAVLEGSPFFAISDATHPGDLLVLTSHGRTGVQRWLMGSVAEKLVREASVPVILVPAMERAEGDRPLG
jgi:nucleotide-binding universal stress UspA family protein